MQYLTSKCVRPTCEASACANQYLSLSLWENNIFDSYDRHFAYFFSVNVDLPVSVFSQDDVRIKFEFSGERR